MQKKWFHIDRILILMFNNNLSTTACKKNYAKHYRIRHKQLINLKKKILIKISFKDIKKNKIGFII